MNITDCAHGLIWGCPHCFPPARLPPIQAMPPPLVDTVCTEYTAQLLSARKLSLVLDLDQTILHSASAHQVAPTRVLQNPHFDHELFTFQDGAQCMFVRFRPFLVDFLYSIRDTYVIHIYTAGVRSYTEHVLRLLALMYRRATARSLHIASVTSRSETQEADCKGFHQLPGCSRALSVVLDDREDVWAQTGPENLLHVKPFFYFALATPGERAAGAEPPQKRQRRDLAEPFIDTADNDAILPRMATLLNAVHAAFYDFQEKPMDVRPFIAGQCGHIFQGCCFLFTGIIPHGMDVVQHPLWQRARRYGAQCAVAGWHSGVTHVIAPRDRPTAKVREAVRFKRPVYLVALDWFMESVSQYERLNEMDYPILDEENHLYLPVKPAENDEQPRIGES